MPFVENLPDLSHWKTVQEFSIEQAALLLAGIDPYDYKNGLESVRHELHPRWKLAYGLSEGIITAIRRGVLTPIQCIAEEWLENGWGEHVEYSEMKPNDRTKYVSKSRTIITRDSLFSWVEKENVDYVRKPPAKIYNQVKQPEIVLPSPPPEKEITPVYALPMPEHKSEGLDFVCDAIKQFWSTYDEDDPSTIPTKQEIIDYLKSRGASTNLAAAVDMVLRPFSARSVGRRKK